MLFNYCVYCRKEKEDKWHIFSNEHIRHYNKYINNLFDLTIDSPICLNNQKDKVDDYLKTNFKSIH